MTAPRRISASALFIVAAFAPAAGAQPAPVGAPVTQGGTPIGPVTPGVFQGDLRALPRARAWQPGDPVLEVPKRVYPRQKGAAVDGQEAPSTSGGTPEAVPDPGARSADGERDVPSSEAGRTFTTPVLNFAGGGFSGVRPPDTVGDVGPNHYIQTINHSAGSEVRIYDKSGTLVAGPVILDSLWTAGGGCANGRGDPIVLYDRLADRWLLSEFSGTGNRLCIYLSRTADPVTGGFFLYDVPTPNFPDYPKYGVWPDAYYVTSNESSPALYALNRNKMLAGMPLAASDAQRFTVADLGGFGFQALTPADHDGPSAPPAGAPGYFMRHRDDESHNPSPNPSQDFLELYELRVNFLNAGASTLTGPISIPVAEFDSNLCGLTSFFCFPQPGTAQLLDPLREVIMWRLQYVNRGPYQSLVGNFVTDVGGDRGGIRWFELRKTGTDSWALFQQGTVAPADGASRWMGSIAMDRAGNIGLAYSVSSSTIFPSIRYTGRLAGDSLGEMPQGEGTILAGQFSQTTSDRWGDYSALSVDPSDDCTFWYTTEYVGTSGLWQTRIATFRFPGCGTSPVLTVSPNTGSFTTPQQFDLVLIVDTVGSPATSLTAALDGADVTTPLANCIQTGTLVGVPGQTFRCPALTGGIFGSGAHVFAATANFANGTSTTSTQTWTVDLALPGITVSPPSGPHVLTQGFDLGIVVNAPGLGIAGGSATLNGSDVTAALLGCLQTDTLPAGQAAFRCPGLSGAVLGAGTYLFSVIVNFSDGSSASGSATWQIRNNTEP